MVCTAAWPSWLLFWRLKPVVYLHNVQTKAPSIFLLTHDMFFFLSVLIPKVLFCLDIFT